MSDGFTVSKKPTFTGYAGIHAGTIKNAADNSWLNAGANLGGKVEYKNTYAKAEVGAGTAYSAKAQVGHEFDLGKNLGLDVSATAQANISSSNNCNFSVFYEEDYTIKDKDYYHNFYSNVDWRSGEAKCGAKANLTFSPKSNIKFGLGAETGVRQSLDPDINISQNIKFTTDDSTFENSLEAAYNGNRTDYYVTPTLEANIAFGKKQKVSLNLEANAFEGNLGLRYNF